MLSVSKKSDIKSINYTVRQNMNRSLPLLLAIAATLGDLCAATTYHEAIFNRLGGPGYLDLDQDGDNDIVVTFPMNLGGPEGPYVLTPLGSTLIASTSGGIAESFSIEDVLDISLLSFIDENESALAGGFIYSSAGFYFGEGWGFELDPDGNPILPPDHFVDLFVADLDNGVAWVDFMPPTSVNDFERRVRWGFSTSDSPMVIAEVPEVSVMHSVLISFVAGALFVRKRRTNRRS